MGKIQIPAKNTISIRKIKSRHAIIKRAIARIVEDKYIYDKLGEYLKNHGIVGKDPSGGLLNFINFNYIDVAIINVCKLAETDSRTESLINLLKDIKDNAGLFKQEWYHDTEGEFKNFFNKRTKVVNKTAVESDIKLLRRVIGKRSKKRYRDSFMKLRDKKKAHSDREDFQSKKTFNDLTEAINTLETIILKYQSLITGHGQEGLLASNIDDSLRIDRLFCQNES